ncbi:TPA: phosphopentomutase [Candidatus Galligastranaerophilus gallistercoris]|nr:phosphopentomutase [Candidatus Galligastranaerophilus gallistercoris]
MNKKRAIIIVIDSMGIGAMDDAVEFNDDNTVNTLCNLAKKAGGLNVPNFEKMGLGNIKDIEGVKKELNPVAQFGIMKPKSKGKDTTTGHWEIAGLVLEHPFKTYEKFDDKIINEFIKETGCKGILGNYPASGTKIIQDLNEEHQKTKFPIIYTSADSVFQIAADIDLIDIETLYNWCKIARKILDEGHYGISRVIARPYRIIDNQPTRISSLRHDFSVCPPKDTLLNIIEKEGGKTFAIGKIKDIFTGSGITESTPTGGNKEGLDVTLDAIKNKKDFSLIFTNLVDTDMLYGHRRDYIGYKKAIEEIDTYLDKFILNTDENDLLIITADHGCDPTFKGSDHTREYVPLIIYNKNIEPKNLGVRDSFCYVSERIKDWLQL